jgi:hypothetical protein
MSTAQNKQVRKTVITLTVLSAADDRTSDPAYNSLEEIAHQMDTGCFLGDWFVQSSSIVPADKVENECVKLGNDGSFFDLASDDDD